MLECPEKTMGVTVRPGGAQDLDWLVGELRAFSDFYGTKRKLFETEEYARTGLEKIINDHVLFVAQKGDVGPVGFIAGLIVPHIFNPTITVLNEAFWWVKPEHRRSRAGYLLLREFVHFGEQNADWLLFTLETHSPVKDAALLKLGFKAQETSYLLEVA